MDLYEELQNHIRNRLYVRIVDPVSGFALRRAELFGPRDVIGPKGIIQPGHVVPFPQGTLVPWNSKLNLSSMNLL